MAKTEADSSTCNNESQINSDSSLCPLGNEGQSPEMIVEDSPNSSDTSHQSVQNGTSEELAQPTGSRATEKKMEDESSQSEGQMSRENKGSHKKETESSSVEADQPPGNISNTQTSGGDRNAVASQEVGERVRCSNMEAPESKDSNSHADHLSQEKKASCSEAEITPRRKVEQDSQQRASAPVSKVNCSNKGSSSHLIMLG